MVAQAGHEGHGADRHEDEAIVEALRRGDEVAFEFMVDRYHRSLVRLAQTFVHDAEVAQEAWIGFMQSLSRFAGRSSLKTWLFGILVNCAHARARKDAKEVTFSRMGPANDEEAALIPEERFLSDGHPWAGHWADPPHTWPEERLLEDEVGHLIQEAILHLPPHQRIVLALRDVEGWSSTEVCEVLAISEGNQRVMLHRARTSVRQELEAYFHEGERGDR